MDLARWSQRRWFRQRWFRQRWFRHLGLDGALSIQITIKSTHQYQSMNGKFLLSINSVNRGCCYCRNKIWAEEPRCCRIAPTLCPPTLTSIYTPNSTPFQPLEPSLRVLFFDQLLTRAELRGLSTVETETGHRWPAWPPPRPPLQEPPSGPPYVVLAS